MRGQIYKLWLVATGRGGELAFLKALKRAEKVSEREVMELQEQLLGQLLRHAYTYVPYYRRIIDALGGG